MTLRFQRGAGFIGWFMIIAIVLGIASYVIKLAPHYIDHRTMRGVLSEMVADDRLARGTSAQFRRAFQERLQINNIRDFDHSEALVVESRAGNLTVDFVYEVREQLFGNADIVLKFDERFERVLR